LAEPCVDLLGRCETVLAEVLNNIAEHGQTRHGQTLHGQTSGPDDWIELHCRRSQDGIHLCVTDHGRALPRHLLSPSDGSSTPLAGLSLDDVPEGGFGWFLIRELARDLCCVRTNTGNRLTFTVPRNPASGAGSA